MRLYIAINFLLGFLLGTVFASALCWSVLTRTVEQMPLEKTAQRVVEDVAQAYQNQLEKDDAFTLCLAQNTRLKEKNPLKVKNVR